MSENEDVQGTPSGAGSGYRAVFAAIVFLFLVTTVGGAIYINRQREETRQLTAGYDRMNMELNLARAELSSMTSKLAAMQTPPPEPVQADASTPAEPVKKNPKAAQGSRHKSAKQTHRTSSESAQWAKMQTDLAEQK